MVFASVSFLFIFLPLFMAVYFNPWWKSRLFRNVTLLLFSLFFYAWGEPIFVLLMIGSILLTWKIALLMECSAHRKRLLTIGIASHAGLLFVFKYVTFLAREFGALTGVNTSAINIALPIGISFFTFQLMSYLFDVYYGKAEAQRSAWRVGLYVALFPQLIAGPIVRYADIEHEIENRQETTNDFIFGMERFIFGLGKKVLIANYLAQVADQIFALQCQVSVATAWIGAVAYALQIYFDFSGYSDMAIGIGRACGFHFAENFNYPYCAKTVTDFWRRWHMSLTSWFRDYVYIPLGGNRVSKGRWTLNLLIVWALTGFWHGANWTFVCWGLFYFAVLMFEKTTGLMEKLRGVRHLWTMAVVIVAWVLFRSESITEAARHLSVMFGFVGATFVDDLAVGMLGCCQVILPLGIILALPVWPRVVNRFGETMLWRNMVSPVLIVGIFLLSLIEIVSSTYNPFIYFNF